MAGLFRSQFANAHVFPQFFPYGPAGADRFLGRKLDVGEQRRSCIYGKRVAQAQIMTQLT